MLKPSEPCTACRKFVVELELHQPVWCLLELPSTFDRPEARYRWRYHDLLGYLMIPRTLDRRTGTVDLFLCIDDDDTGSFDLEGYARKFLSSLFQSKYPQVRDFYLRLEERSVPPDVACRVRTHEVCQTEELRS